MLSPGVRRNTVHTIRRVFLGNIFQDIIKANPSFKLGHIHTTLRSYLTREPTLQFTSKANASVLNAVYGNDDESIGKLPGALQRLEANGYKTHFKVFTANHMMSVFVNNDKSAHIIKWKNNPISQQPPFNTDALRLTMSPVQENCKGFAGRIIDPRTSLKME